MLSNYFTEWQRAGTTRIWTDISDSLKPGQCQFSNSDGRTPDYYQWADGYPEKGCVKDENQDTCAYINILGGVKNNWETGNCFQLEG